jgi:hypothetical protein
MVAGEDFSLDSTGPDLSHVEWRSSAPTCPAGTMEVATFLGVGTPPSGGELDHGGFELVFGSSSDQGFSFVIP